MNYALILWVFLALLWPSAAAARVQTGGDVPPPVFDKRPYKEAKKAAAEDRKWFIVNATAEWCGPCKRMDKTTWRDEKVVAWLNTHAITVQLDVDEEAKLAGELRIEAMPTVIALREGDREFDRIVGYRNPMDFLTWMEGIARGERSLDTIAKRAGRRDGAAGSVDVRARLDLARSLQQSGRLDEATDEYVWLWQHMLEHQPSYSGVRVSFMAGDMERLAARNGNAKKRFTVLRDEVGKTISEEKVRPNDFIDWIVLNRIVADNKLTLSWFDGVKDDQYWKSVLDRVSYLLESLLIQEKRWADLGKLYPDPAGVLERAFELRQRAGSLPVPPAPDDRAQKILDEMPTRMFRTKAGCLYAGLLAGGREADAKKVAQRSRELDDTTGMLAVLVSTALDAGQPRPEHAEWLTAAVRTDASLKGLLKRVQNDLAHPK